MFGATLDGIIMYLVLGLVMYLVLGLVSYIEDDNKDKGRRKWSVDCLFAL